MVEAKRIRSFSHKPVKKGEECATRRCSARPFEPQVPAPRARPLPTSGSHRCSSSAEAADCGQSDSLASPRHRTPPTNPALAAPRPAARIQPGMQQFRWRIVPSIQLPFMSAIGIRIACQLAASAQSVEITNKIAATTLRGWSAHFLPRQIVPRARLRPAAQRCMRSTAIQFLIASWR